MKKSFLKIAEAAVLMVSAGSTAALFAKPNQKAQTYKTHEVADSSADKSVPVNRAETSVPKSNLQSLLFWSLEAETVFVLAQEARKSVAKNASIKRESDFFM